MNAHRVELINLHGETHYCILTTYRGQEYIFRYGYDEYAKAADVANTLEHGNSNCDWDTDLAFNYWFWPSQKGYKLSYGRLTTQKYNWHIIRSEV